MTGPSKVDRKPIGNKNELVEWFEKSCTPADKLLIGVEHEKPPFYLSDNAPVSYDGEKGRAGIHDFIQKMIADKGWTAGAIEYNASGRSGRADIHTADGQDGIILSVEKDNANWTFEPGLQMETGGAPLKNVHQTAQETDELLKEAIEVAQALGFGLLAQGYHPTHRSEDMPLMPKSRYELLRNYVQANNFTNGLDIMSCTSTVQVNMGYQSEEDMVKMLRVSLALQPIVVALFANSPFAEGKPTGYQSTRSHKLYNKFGGRYGFTLPIAFDEGFGFEMFVDYAMKTMPVMGIYKGDVFLDAKGGKFADFMKGKLSVCKGQKATISDWQNHLNTIWPEVRLRRFLEMRGADNGPAEMIKALPAFWAGLLYDKTSLDSAYQMIKDWTQQDREYLRVIVSNTGLQTPFLSTTVQDIALNCLTISQAGLKRRGVLNGKGQDESVYLEPLYEIATSGLNWASRLEKRFRNEWKGNISPLFNEMSYANEPSVLKTPKIISSPKIIPPSAGV